VSRPETRAPALPAGATDAHVHVFDPKRHPYAPDAAYRPQPHECGTADDLAATLASHGVDRVVIVSPTAGYRDDMRCMLDAVERLRGRARGIARGPLDVSARELKRWKARGVSQRGFRALLAAMAGGRCWVKLSGAMRFSRRPPPYADVNRFVARLLAEGGPGRVVWGSDWPFLRTERRVDYGPMLAQLAAWVPDARQRRCILVDASAELFGFG